jgi:hypothetical protein
MERISLGFVAGLASYRRAVKDTCGIGAQMGSKISKESMNWVVEDFESEAV